MRVSGGRRWEAEVARAQVSVSPVLVEVARRRVNEAEAAGRQPSAATVLIANAHVPPPTRGPDGATGAKGVVPASTVGRPARTRKPR